MTALLRYAAPFLALSLVAQVAGYAQTRAPFTFGDYYKVVSVSDAQISPDGSQIAVIVTRADESADKNVSELDLVDVATKSARAITQDRPDVSTPRWSPDGTELGFIAADSRGTPQVWVMPMHGGDAQPVTRAATGVELFAWRPDGKAIAYVAEDPPPNEMKAAAQDDLFRVGDQAYMSRAAARPSHLWLQVVGAQAAQRLTEGAWSIFPDTISWSSDGRYIAFERTPFAGFDAFLRDSRVAVLEVRNKRLVQIERTWSWNPSFAPRGDRLAFAVGGLGDIVQTRPVITTVGSNTLHEAAHEFDRNVHYLSWLPGGGGLLAAADDRVTQGLFRIAPDGAVRRLALGDLTFQDGTVSASAAIAFTASAPQRPPELYYLPAGSNVPQRLTDYNAAVTQLDTTPSREFTWRNDSFEEDGVLTYPVGYERGKRYPLVLVIHGCCGASQSSFDPLVQLLAARGFFVLQPNYRGSDNLGYAYANAMVGDPVNGPASDCMAGVKALERTGMVDPARVGISGWSMGGWLTSWIITHDTGFKAAVSGAAVDDATMEYTLSQVDALLPYLLNGLRPWSPRGFAAYRAVSPVAFAQNVNVPTLILSDSDDPNVPTPESYEFYAALRDLHKTVTFVAAPAYGHHPADPVRNVALYRAWVDWMVKYL
jgi:dipeptidyl aminopeptidase/acylaminoacyl peptidase